MSLISNLIHKPVVHEYHDHHDCKCAFIPPYIQEMIRDKQDDPIHREHMQGEIEKDRKVLKKRAKFFSGKKRAEVQKPELIEGRVKIYDAQNKTALPGVLVTNPGDSADLDVKNSYNWAYVTNDFFNKIFKRNSLDNNGMTIITSVNYPEFNAFWNGRQLLIGETNNSTYFESFSSDVDVTSHEFGHGVTQYHGNLPYDKQSGALNEHFSDVYGCMAKQFHFGLNVEEEGGWLIGDILLKPWGNGEYDTRGALRTMTEKKGYENHPYLGTDPQPKHMSGYVNTTADYGGVHYNSGIPNHAFYLASQKFSQYNNLKYAYTYSENGIGDVWYLAENKLKELGYRKPTFAQAAGVTVLIAENMFGTGSQEVGLIRTAWTEVGVTPNLSGGTNCSIN